MFPTTSVISNLSFFNSKYADFFFPLDDLSLKLSKTVIIYVQLFIINLAKSSQTSHRSCLLVSFCCQPSPGFHCCWFNAFLHRSALFLLLTISIAQQVHTYWLLFYLCLVFILQSSHFFKQFHARPQQQ